jgi:hypothetical protein
MPSNLRGAQRKPRRLCVQSAASYITRNRAPVGPVGGVRHNSLIVISAPPYYNNSCFARPGRLARTASGDFVSKEGDVVLRTLDRSERLACPMQKHQSAAVGNDCERQPARSIGMAYWLATSSRVAANSKTKLWSRAMFVGGPRLLIRSPPRRVYAHVFMLGPRRCPWCSSFAADEHATICVPCSICLRRARGSLQHRAPVAGRWPLRRSCLVASQLLPSVEDLPLHERSERTCRGPSCDMIC